MGKTNFKNVKSDGKTADIYIYGPIGYSWYDDNSWDAAGFVAEFNRLAETHERINIRINSPGGIIDEGLPIFNAIASCAKDTHTYIDGIAYSMGAIIALAGKTVHAAKNSLMLFHNASGWSVGNAQEFRETATMLDTYDSSLITSLSGKTGMTEDEIRKNYFDYKDHLLNASDAKTAGFIDVIEDNTAKLPEDIASMTSNQLFQLFQNKDQKDPVFAKLIDFFKNSLSFTNKPPDPMENAFKLICVALALAENATAEMITGAIDALKQKVTDLEQKVTDLTTAEAVASASSKSLSDAINALDPSVTKAETVQAKVIALNTFVTGLKAADAADITVAGKEKDKIEAPADDSATFSHNQAADKFLG